MAVEAETKTEPTHKTCFIKIVRTGHYDLGIRVYPALHESETIDLSNQRGIERLEYVQKMFDRYSERGKYVEKPVPTPEDPGNTRSGMRPLDKFPCNKLEGFVFEPLPDPKGNINSKAKEDPTKVVSERVDRLEAKLDKVMDLLLAKAATTPAEFACDTCGKAFPTARALNMHEVGAHNKK